MKNFILLLTGLTLILGSCSPSGQNEFEKSITLSVQNTIALERTNVLLQLAVSDLIANYPDFNPQAFVVVNQGKELSSQFNPNDGTSGQVLFILDSITPNESRNISIEYNPVGVVERNYPKLTQAELSHKVGGKWKDREYIGGEFKNVDFLRVPPEHKDHSWYIRYEGPGWESDKVGYRFYLDQRNATDVFGKKVTEPVLQKVGLDGFDSYHELSDWGMDVMKVGKTLGVGSIGMMEDTLASRVEFTDSITAEIQSNGVIYSSILTNYYGWKTANDTLDVASSLSIHAGTRLTHQVLALSEDSEKFCTGIGKDSKAALFKRAPSESSFGYIASYGAQSLNNDNLGVAVLFDLKSFNEFTEDSFSHIVKLKSSGKVLEYYFLAAWEGEANGIKTEAEFLNYLDQTAKELANPIMLSMKL